MQFDDGKQMKTVFQDEQTCIIAPGRYIDQLERRDGEWRILLRRCTVEMSAQGTTEFLHSPAVKGFPKGVWDRDDLSYERPLTLNAAGARW